VSRFEGSTTPPVRSSEWKKQVTRLVTFRKTLYASLDPLHVDLDCYLDFHNRERAHQG
jgi:hypothetical protein